MEEDFKTITGSVVTKHPVASQITIQFGMEGIGLVDEHLEEINAIRNAGANDHVILYFTGCPGGAVDTGLALINAIESTEAHVIAVVEGHNASLATIIPFSADEMRITKYSSWMIHSAHGGVWGTVKNAANGARFQEERLAELLEDTYKGFLTKKEIQSVKDGVEMYLSYKDINDRLIARNQKQIRKANKKRKVKE